MGCRAPQAPSTRTRLGVPACGRSAWWPGGPDAGRAFVTLSMSSAGVRCPVSDVRCEQCPRLPVHGTGVQCPVRASERPGVSVQVSAVRRPVSASGVCALPRPLCPADVRSWSAAVGRQPYSWDGRGRRGRPLRPCPARGLPESAPRARSWRRRCWASRGVGLDLAVVGRWLGSGQLGRVADQDGPGAREDRSLVGAGARRGLPSAAG